MLPGCTDEKSARAAAGIWNNVNNKAAQSCWNNHVPDV